MTDVELLHGAASGRRRRLVAAAVSFGGRDNAAAVVVDVVGLVPDRPCDSDAQRLSLEQKLGALP